MGFSLFPFSGKGAFSPSKKNLVPFGCTMKSFDSMWQAGTHVSFLVKIKDTQLLRWLHPSRVWGKACLIDFTIFTRWHVSWISCTEWFSAVAACNSPPLGLLFWDTHILLSYIAQFVYTVVLWLRWRMDISEIDLAYLLKSWLLGMVAGSFILAEKSAPKQRLMDYT